MESRTPWSAWLLVALSLLVLALRAFWSSAEPVVLAYSDFQSLLQAGRIKEVSIAEQQLSGVVDLAGSRQLLPEVRRDSTPEPELASQSFVVARVPDSNLVSDLRAAGVKFAGRVENRWLGTLLTWIASLVIFAVVWSFLLRRLASRPIGGIMDVGKSKAKVFVQTETGVHFSDVAGIDEAKGELMEVVDFLKNPGRYRRLGGQIPKGVLIVGAPGTGKTLLAKAVAGEAAVPFLSISGSEFVELFVGVGAARVRDLFQQAERLAPCIIFIDELDALGKARGVSLLPGNDEREQTLNQLLVQMDGFDTKNGVIILAATNRPEILDPALLRPGRFDRQVALDRPDIKGREQILKVHAKRLTLGEDVDLVVIAGKTAGFAGADLANLVNEAALRAARLDKPAVDLSDFDAAIERAVAGLEKKSRVMNAKEKRTVAYHEAGHALVAESRPTADKVAKISIIPRGFGALGFTQQQLTEDRYLLKRSELLERLDVMLGGRVAEQLIFGESSTGALNDLQHATDLARQMIMRYGMSERLGPATLEVSRAPLLLPEGITAANRADYSERTARIIDDEVRALLGESERRVYDTLVHRRGQLEALAQLLLRQESVERATLLELLGPPATPPAPRPEPAGQAATIVPAGPGDEGAGP